MTLLPTGDPIFLHRPHGLQCHGITQEVIHDFELLSEFVLRNADRKQYRVPEYVTLVTYHNYKFKCLLESCYEAYGIHDYVVLGREVVQWDWSAKITLVLDYLESGACTTPYILCTDANDVLMVGDPGTMIDRFLSYGCDVLFCNTFVDYPPNKVCRDFETLKYYTHPLHCRLSAGGYIARREPLIACLRTLKQAADEKSPWAFFDGVFNDQLGWRMLHAQLYPRIQVDSQSLIFKRYDVFRSVDES